MPTSKKLDKWTGTTGRTTDQIFEYLFTNKGLIGRVVQKSMEAYQLGITSGNFLVINLPSLN